MDCDQGNPGHVQLVWWHKASYVQEASSFDILLGTSLMQGYKQLAHAQATNVKSTKCLIWYI